MEIWFAWKHPGIVNVLEENSFLVTASLSSGICLHPQQSDECETFIQNVCCEHWKGQVEIFLDRFSNNFRLKFNWFYQQINQHLYKELKTAAWENEMLK